MSPTTQLLLTVIGSALGGGALGAIVTAIFARPKTSAEATKFTADANKTNAEASGEWVKQLQSAVDDWTKVTAAYTDCVKGKATAEIAVLEREAEIGRMKAAMELVVKENEKMNETITELRGKLRGCEGK